MERGFLDLHKSEYKDRIINSLCQGIDKEIGKFGGKAIDHKYRFSSLLNYVIEKKYQLFDREEFKGCLYSEEDEILDLILPTIRRVYAKIFIDPPTLFKDSSIPYAQNLRYQLFILYFDIDEFIDYLIDMFLKVKDCLHHFEYIDRTSETLALIVDNYIANLVKKVRDVNNYEAAVNGFLTQLKREDAINNIFSEDINNDLL